MKNRKQHKKVKQKRIQIYRLEKKNKLAYNSKHRRTVSK